MSHSEGREEGPDCATFEKYNSCLSNMPYVIIVGTKLCLLQINNTGKIIN